jgi:hypothetical protein
VVDLVAGILLLGLTSATSAGGLKLLVQLRVWILPHALNIVDRTLTGRWGVVA